jgi:hypothetical protein
MKSGQLMGSILSFPILCLANLGVYLLNTQEIHKNWTDQERLDAVLINGDDMLYASPVDLWPSHIKIGNAVGLKMSVGKAYHHSEYLNVNSTSVHYDLSQNHKVGRTVTPFQIDFLNTGLFFGQSKVMNNEASISVDKEDKNSSISTNVNRLMQGCLPGRQGQILSQYMSRHSEALRKECQVRVYEPNRNYLMTRNLFLPISRGGMGCDPPVGFKFHTKPSQRALAFAHLSGKMSESPLTGTPPISEETETPIPLKLGPEQELVDYRKEDGTIVTVIQNVKKEIPRLYTQCSIFGGRFFRRWLTTQIYEKVFWPKGWGRFSPPCYPVCPKVTDIGLTYETFCTI